MESINRIKIIIADDHKLVRCGFKLLLETDPKITITSEAVSGEEVLKQLKTNKDADIILADINMPGISGMELLQRLRASHKSIRIIFLSMLEDDTTITTAFKNGVDGYLTKDISAEELIFAINHVYNGGKYVSSSLSNRFLEKSLQFTNLATAEISTLEFNSREIEVLELISEGLTNSEMGEKLFLSKRTVEGHRRALIEKTQCRNSASLVRYAVMHGLIK